jgi:hypothetical protein
VHLRWQLCTNQREKKDALGRTLTKYEHEWRIINGVKGLNGVKGPNGMRGPGPQDFPEDALIGVILGCGISQENKENILRWCRNRKHSPSLYEAREKQKEFGLDIVRIENY